MTVTTKGRRDPSPVDPSGSHPRLEAADWYQALTLSERLRDRRRFPAEAASTDIEQTEASRRLSEWRAQSPFDVESCFLQRLRSDGLAQEELFEMLGESAESLARRHPTQPAWLRFIAHAYGEHRVEISATEKLSFTAIVRPMIRAAIAQLSAVADRLAQATPSVPFDPAIVAHQLLAGLPEELDAMLSRTVVLEMRVAGLQGKLDAYSKEERFQRFVWQLAQPEAALDFLQEYCVLARLLAERLMRWAEVSGELLERLAADREGLASTFQPGTEIGQLTGVSGGLGDSHRGGRTVRVLHFDSGLKVVYKPRDLTIDLRFGELLDWLNSKGAPELRAAKILNRDHYGWCEFIPFVGCRSEAEVERFYRRQGAFLALLYGLNANDFHRENLIAFGEHPMLIDLESLCPADYGMDDRPAHESLADLDLYRSVKRVMLLPYLRKGLKARHVVDTSGLGGDGNQLSSDEIPTWKGIGTEEMTLARERQNISAAGNRPTLDGEVVNPLSYRRHLMSGFEAMYRLLLEHRTTLLDGDSPLRRFLGVEVRAIFRASAFYSFILRESYHPDLLRNALDRDRLIDRLWFGFERTKFPDIALRLIPQERESIWRGDLPYFTNRLGSRDVPLEDGGELSNIFIRSGFDMVRRYLGFFSQDDLQKQLDFIHKSLIGLEMSSDPGAVQYTLTRPPIEADSPTLMAAAVAVADRIVELAHTDEDEASWLGMAMVAEHGWQLRSLETDLYGGLPGILLFLGYLGEVSDDRKYYALALRTLPVLRKKVHNRRKTIQAVGAYDGWAGLIYAWTHLGVLLQRPDLLAEAEEFLEDLAPLIADDEELDMMRGCAGGIVPLLSYHRVTGSPRALELARQMGDRLIDRAEAMEVGVGWKGAACPIQALTGFSHGAAGISYALIELYGATGEDAYREMGLKGLAFENSLFSPKLKNWPDLRGGHNLAKGQRIYMTSWCHGAPGIGLARLRMQRHLPDMDLSQDIQAAVETTLSNGFGSSHCLCHGDLGNLELVLEASRSLDDPRWQEELRSVSARVLGTLDEHGYRCGVPLEAETPGLMSGLAGIGLGLLRQAAPERVPSVLLLDPPPAP